MLRHSSDFTTGEPVRLASRIYAEFHRLDDVSPLVIEGLILELLAEAARHQSPDVGGKAPKWLQDVRDIARNSFIDCPRLSDVAADVAIHPVHLCREFRKYFGCTFGEYLRQLRLAYASEQLLRSRK